VHVVWPDDKLGDVLRELKQGRSHMALVRDVNNADATDPFYEIKGIITLEDIIEEIIGSEIVDETDAFVDGTHSAKVDRLENFDWGRLRLLDSKIVDEILSYEEAKAVTAHLRANYSSAVAMLTDKQIHRLVAETSVTELPTAVQEVGVELPVDLLYEKGVGPTDLCTLILSGKVTAFVGEDKFRSDLSSWAVLGSSALSNIDYIPDFTAFVSSGPCRCLRFSREQYQAAMDASAVERQHNQHANDSSLTPTPTPITSSLLERSFRSLQAGPDNAVMDPASDPKLRDAKKPHVRRMKLIAAFQSASKKEVNSSESVSPVVSEGVGRVSFANPLEPASLSHALGGGSYHAGPRLKREVQRDETQNTPTAETRIAGLKPSGSSIEFIGASAKADGKDGPLN
jgi:CBS domain